jgi:hypothetical protein
MHCSIRAWHAHAASVKKIQSHCSMTHDLAAMSLTAKSVHIVLTIPKCPLLIAMVLLKLQTNLNAHRAQPSDIRGNVIYDVAAMHQSTSRGKERPSCPGP